MLYSLTDLMGYEIEAEGNRIGSIADFIFHEDNWVVRYLVVAAEDGGRHFLVAPRALAGVDENRRVISSAAARDRILSSPAFNPDQPVSRQLETEVYDYFEWPYYWDEEKAIPPTAEGDLTAVPLAEMEADLEQQQEEMAEELDAGTQRFHRFSRVSGFVLHDRNDLPAGEIDDFIIDDGRWTIFYAVVSAAGRKVLVSPSLIEHIDWEEDHGLVDLTVETIATSPEYDLASLRLEAGNSAG